MFFDLNMCFFKIKISSSETSISFSLAYGRGTSNTTYYDGNGKYVGYSKSDITYSGAYGTGKAETGYYNSDGIEIGSSKTDISYSGAYSRGTASTDYYNSNGIWLGSSKTDINFSLATSTGSSETSYSAYEDSDGNTIEDTSKTSINYSGAYSKGSSNTSYLHFSKVIKKKLKEKLDDKLTGLPYAAYGVVPENMGECSRIDERRNNELKNLTKIQLELTSTSDKFQEEINLVKHISDTEQYEIKKCSQLYRTELNKQICSVQIQHKEYFNKKSSATKLLEEFKKGVDQYKNSVHWIKSYSNDIYTIAPVLYAQYLRENVAFEEFLTKQNQRYDAGLSLINSYDRIYGECDSQIYKLTMSTPKPTVTDSKGFGSPGEADFHAGYKHYLLGAYLKALPHLERAAAQGYPPAYQKLARIYQEGMGVVKDSKVAQRWSEKVKAEWSWFESRAKSGHAETQTDVGSCYYHGITVEKNIKEAVRWFQLAANKGYPVAQYSLGSQTPAGCRVISH